MSERPVIAWPVKTREIISHHFDSRAWNNFVFRDGDIVVATYAKSGTTWTQQILSQLIFDGAEDIDVHRLSPWVDLRILPPELRLALDHQTHRRFLKTHLPVDALVMSPKAKYIYLARDGRDAAWSFHNHHYNATDEYFSQLQRRPAGASAAARKGLGGPSRLLSPMVRPRRLSHLAILASHSQLVGNSQPAKCHAHPLQ